MDDWLTTDNKRNAIEARVDGILARKTSVEAFTKLAADLAADIPALLAHIRAQDTRILQLQLALNAAEHRLESLQRGGYENHEGENNA